MPRSMADQHYEHRPWSEEHRARLSAIHRKRWGAPEGYCTVRGVHVPFEHRAPVRYWSDWCAHHQGKDAARQWIESLKADEWFTMPRLWELYRARLEIAKTRDFIREFQWEVRYGHSNDT
jgi:hypothetical protein